MWSYTFEVEHTHTPESPPVAVAVGPSGDGPVLFVQLMERRRAGMGGPGAARALEAVRDVSMAALARSRRRGLQMRHEGHMYLLRIQAAPMDGLQESRLKYFRLPNRKYFLLPNRKYFLLPNRKYFLLPNRKHRAVPTSDIHSVLATDPMEEETSTY
ncbi:hypothetical protein EYF80_055868 [Liparis tanakae]|uniref:Uncharacterized protein n=1 Tax=Liparis tanakae TaxID=230148 RepID=A0A4Z2EZF0_9TELE|nr:hypothetical protein EYF80_055868 [Liparis tanakae]